MLNVIVRCGKEPSISAYDGRTIWAPIIMKKLSCMPDYEFNGQLDYDFDDLYLTDIIALPGGVDMFEAESIGIAERSELLQVICEKFGLQKRIP
jgi:hypothetical protein